MKYVIFYHFTNIENPELVKDNIKGLFEELEIKGTALIGNEGINAAYTVSEENHEKAIEFFNNFGNIDYKIQDTDKHEFDKTKVKVKEEILTLKQDIDMNNKGEYVEAEQLKEWIETQDIVIVDMRNDYEARIGHFNNAIKPNISRFRDLPKFVEKLEKFKDKKIVTYCTGGIRCEKATAYMKQKGFNKVYQLHGGIIRYGQKVGSEHWQGKCFVFDNRLAIDIGTGAPPISECNHCSTKSSQYAQCTNQQCDQFFVVCNDCNNKLCNNCIKA